MLNLHLGSFSIQVTHALGIMSVLIAAAVGHLSGRRQKTGICIGIVDVLLDMSWLGLLSARIVFVILCSISTESRLGRCLTCVTVALRHGPAWRSLCQ